MHNKANFKHSLSEFERLAYLEVMGVPEWISRVSTEESESEYDTGKERLYSEEERFNLTHSSLQTNVQAVSLKAESANIKSSISTSLPEDSVSDIKSTEQGETHYLKLVNWGADSSADSALLIICRHDTEQPAQSFAKPNYPSQFMLDYIQALQSFLLGSKLKIQVRLGHLSEAGLGHDCDLLQRIVSELQPGLVLILGDETVKKLFKVDDEVASKRGKVQTLDISDRCIVSYHPFTLINNPHLKSLAMEDLKLVANMLLANKE